jgi:hypothetical protein
MLAHSIHNSSVTAMVWLCKRHRVMHDALNSVRNFVILSGTQHILVLVFTDHGGFCLHAYNWRLEFEDREKAGLEKES